MSINKLTTLSNQEIKEMIITIIDTIVVNNDSLTIENINDIIEYEFNEKHIKVFELDIDNNFCFDIE